MDASAQRALNEKHRKLWLGYEAADLMTCRLVMEPLRELMKQHLDMSGTRWEYQQLHQPVADDIAGTDRQRPSLWQRTWSWRRSVLKPYTCCSLRRRSGRSCRRLVSTLHIAAASSAWSRASGRCSAPSTARSRLPSSDSCGRPPKQLRPQSVCAHFLKEHPDPCADEALVALTAIAVLCKVDIAQIECHHAAVRRLLKSRTQSHVMNSKNCQGTLWHSGTAVGRRDMRPATPRRRP